jgi:hypothetical protein
LTARGNTVAVTLWSHPMRWLQDLQGFGFH